ncbi:MAG: Rrf2 family transcriptional regulator [Chlorobiaceae bacterium]|nr:Rrf2 family transcriptional regulator [Chlorobiaceae bacterium]
MKVLTKKTDYAIRALLMLAESKDRYVSAKTISLDQEIPYQFLRGLLQELIRLGHIVSREGAQGGFMISRDPEEIRVKQLIEGFQGQVQVSECMFRKQVCANRAKCVLRHEIMRIEQVVNNEFDKITIGSLLRNLQMIKGMAPALTTGELPEENGKP